jgi:unsaturated rhamnogalacturonyl hydrolase
MLGSAQKNMVHVKTFGSLGESTSGVFMRVFHFSVTAVAILAVCGAMSWAQGEQKNPSPWSQRAANAAMARWPNGHTDGPNGKPGFKYELGTYLEGIDAVWMNTGDARYYNYIKTAVDEVVTPEGMIPSYKPAEYQLDSILMGRQLLRLYGVTQDKHYLTAAGLLYEQLQKQPRTASGGFWHKERYPHQMWLDGLYMAEPFYAEYATVAHHPENYADIARQFTLVAEHMRDARTGLLYHGWDESKQQRWADKATGLSPEFWARAMGWYMMALVDTLDYLPENDPGRKQLVAILNEESAALARVQDAKTGLWYQVLDKGNEKGNYVESSASCMIVYALAKGVRRGYLPEQFLTSATHGYEGILKNFIEVGSGDDVSLTKTVKVGGLGGTPYRSGSYAYYLSEPIVANDPKGVGPFIEAAVEMENAQRARLGRGVTVAMDGWFNSQQMRDAFDQPFYFHYKWNYQGEAGYSTVGRILENFGAHTTEIDAEPTAARLKNAQVFFVVSPDNLAKNPKPNYANARDAEALAQWVKAGGVLVILQNDSSVADLEHFNVVAEKFGLHFNNVLRKHVVGTDWATGKIAVDGKGTVFHQPHTLYMKDVCTISVSGAARPLLQEGEDVFMAQSKFGKGTVIAVVDPWIYNEYVDGRKLPAAYDNYAGGVEFVRYILAQVPHK